MAFSYEPALQTQKDQVRFLLQDTTNTETRPAYLDDGEILWALKQNTNVYMAAAICADALAGKMRGIASKSVGGLSISYAASGKAWNDLAARLRELGPGGSLGSAVGVPTAGGIEKADNETMWADDSLLRPEFYRGMQETPGTYRPNPGDSDEYEP
jgi:hypothetical protein